MTRFIQILTAGLIATAAFGGAVNAATMPQADRALATDPDPRFMVMSIDAMEKHDMNRDYYASLTPQSPVVRELHAAIDENRVLHSELKAQNVEINNVVGAEQAADGSFVLYLR